MKRPAKWLFPILAFALTPTGARGAGNERFEVRVDDRIDLHAHLFFHEGAGLGWFGSFTGPIRATGWRDRIRSKVNEEALELSASRMVAVALYSHPLFLGSQRNVIRRQIAAAEEFVASHPTWVIARSASEARDAYASGKRILIFTLEGADGVLETEEDFKEFVDQKGIRIVTPLHFINDQYGGAALMPGLAALVSPVAWLRSLWEEKDVEGVRLNPEGLTPRGEKLIRDLLARGVWIDLSHASDAAFADMLPLLEEAKQPLLYTHTMLRSVYRAERGISKKQLGEVARTGGIVGLIPSEDIIGATPVTSATCTGPECTETCARGIPALAAQFLEISQIVGPASVGLGTDINAPLTFLPADCGSSPAPEASGRATDPQNPAVDGRGFFQYGQLGEIWDGLRKRQIGVGRLPGLKAARFMEIWSSVHPWTKAQKSSI